MLIKISYKASSYFSRLLNATADGWASKPSTHNTFSFRPRTSLELQENGFFFRFSSCFFFSSCVRIRKMLLKTNHSCFFISSCQNRFYYLLWLITLLFFFRSLVFTTVPALIPNYYIVFRRIKSVLKQFENATMLHNVTSHWV